MSAILKDGLKAAWTSGKVVKVILIFSKLSLLLAQDNLLDVPKNQLGQKPDLS